MAIRDIVKGEDYMLRGKAKPVERFDQRLWQLLDDMYDTMVAADGVGLAGPQVSVRRRIVVIDVGEGRIELINPEIITRAGELEDIEGCLSFPGEYGVVLRPERVAVRALDRNGKEFVIEGEQLLARALCHEIDHLDGRVFKDLVLRMVDPEEWMQAKEKRGQKE